MNRLEDKLAEEFRRRGLKPFKLAGDWFISLCSADDADNHSLQNINLTEIARDIEE